jgi:hypothetical protein
MNVIAERTGYEIDVEAPSGATYTITSDGTTVDRVCTPPETGGCPDSGNWG